jgi:hypothetical protein
MTGAWIGLVLLVVGHVAMTSCGSAGGESDDRLDARIPAASREAYSGITDARALLNPKLQIGADGATVLAADFRPLAEPSAWRISRRS